MAPWIGPAVAAPLWGIGSAQLVLLGWRAYANAFIAVVALVRGRMAGARTVGRLFAALVTGVICSVLLRAGFWWLVEVMGFGRTLLEQVLYCTSLGLALRFMLPRLASQIGQSWRKAMDAAVPAESGAAGKAEGR